MTKRNLAGNQSGIYVRSAESRLALRPQRVPGVAPDCEDARVGPWGNTANPPPVTLPKLKFLERKE